MELQVDFSFSAAHRLPFYDGPCRRVHGHNYKLRVSVAGHPDPASGMLIDFEVLKRTVQHNLLDALDHRLLNELLENPTAENLVVWCWTRLKEPLPDLVEVRLWETENYCVVHRGD